MKRYVYSKSHDTIFEITEIKIKYPEFSDGISVFIHGLRYGSHEPSTITLYTESLSKLEGYIKPLSHWQEKYPELFI